MFGLDVLPQYQRRGIAADLMEHLIADAWKRGKKGMILTCKERLLSLIHISDQLKASVSELNTGMQGLNAAIGGYAANMKKLNDGMAVTCLLYTSRLQLPIFGHRSLLRSLTGSDSDRVPDRR